MTNKVAKLSQQPTVNSQQPTDNSQQPLLSIIIPVYKVEKYLDKCVMSVVNQTYKNLEIILVDDGSPDNCPEMCDLWAEKDSRIRVIHKENGGLSSARNAGLDAMRGELVGFVDSDDYIDLEMFEKLYKLMADNDADLAACDLVAVDEEGSPMSETFSYPLINTVLSREEVLNAFFKNSELGRLCVAWNKLYKSEIFKTLRFTEGKIHEDEIIIHRVLGACSKIAVTDEILYFYVQRDESIMSEVHAPKFHLEHFRSLVYAYKDRYNYFMSIDQPELAKNSVLKIYALLIKTLSNANYLKHRREINKIFAEVLRAFIMSKSLWDKYRACKLCLMCLLSMCK